MGFFVKIPVHRVGGPKNVWDTGGYGLSRVWVTGGSTVVDCIYVRACVVHMALSFNQACPFLLVSWRRTLIPVDETWSRSTLVWSLLRNATP